MMVIVHSLVSAVDVCGFVCEDADAHSQTKL